MKVYVLTTTDGGDNEIFCGVVSNLALIQNPEGYYIYEVEVDSSFNSNRAGVRGALSQKFNEVIRKD